MLERGGSAYLVTYAKGIRGMDVFIESARIKLSLGRYKELLSYCQSKFDNGGDEDLIADAWDMLIKRFTGLAGLA